MCRRPSSATPGPGSRSAPACIPHDDRPASLPAGALLSARCGTLHHMTKLAWIGAITLDCDDAEAMRSFYAAALAGEEVTGFPHTIRVGEMLLNFRELHDWIRPS